MHARVLEKSLLCVCLAHVVSVGSWREADRGPGLPHAGSGVSVPGNPQKVGRNKDPALLQRVCVVGRGSGPALISSLSLHSDHTAISISISQMRKPRQGGLRNTPKATAAKGAESRIGSQDVGTGPQGRTHFARLLCAYERWVPGSSPGPTPHFPGDSICRWAPHSLLPYTPARSASSGV